MKEWDQKNKLNHYKLYVTTGNLHGKRHAAIIDKFEGFRTFGTGRIECGFGFPLIKIQAAPRYHLSQFPHSSYRWNEYEFNIWLHKLRFKCIFIQRIWI